MQKHLIACFVLICLICLPASAANLLFFADYNKDCNAVYAMGSSLAVVHHDAIDDFPDIGLSADGSGKFLASTPNKALYNPNTANADGTNPATDEYVKYNGYRNFSYKSGTFAAWVKPTQQSRFYQEGRIIGVGDHPLGFGNSWFLWDYDGYDNRQFSIGGTDGNGHQASVSVALNAVNGYDSVSVRDRWFFVVGSWQLNSSTNSMWLKVSVRDQYATTFSSATTTVSGMTSLFNESRPLLVGTSCWEVGDVWGQSGYGGYIDWVQIYDGVLDDANVAALYNKTVESIAQPPQMPRLTFMATFNDPSGSLDADYAYASKTSTVYHGGISPVIGQSADGTGHFSTSGHNRALYNPNSAFWDGIQFDGLSYEYLKYPAVGSFKFEGGTFAMWYKPTVYRPLLDALLIGDNAHWSYSQSWYLVHRQKSAVGPDPNIYPIQQLVCFYGSDTSGASMGPTAELNVDDSQSASRLGEWIFIAGTWKLDATQKKMATSVWYRKAGDSIFHVAMMDVNDPNNHVINPPNSVTDLYVGSGGLDGRNGIGGYLDRVLIYDGPITYYGQLEKLYLDTVESLPNPDTCTDVAARFQLMAADINADCKVDMKDLRLFAGNWLKCNDPQNGLCQ